MRTLDEVLRSGNPHRTPVTVTPQAAVSLANLTRAQSAILNSRRKRHRATAIGIGMGTVAFLTLGAGAVTLATGGIHTGWFVPDNSSENGPAGAEILNLSDPGIVAVVQQEEAKVQIPPGSSYAQNTARYPVPLLQGLRTTGTQGELQMGVQFYAACLWQQDWLDGNTTRRAIDEQFISANFPNWDSGLARVAQALQSGDSGLLRQWLIANGPC
jgi:hypothetical protein